MTSTWHHIESGAGRPLILLHGIGMSKAAWAPVMPILAARRRVIAFDIPGFGRTPPLPAGTPQTHDTLAVSLAQTLSALGVEGPVDLVGNSMGGQLALVAARQGLARSVVALSPGGLWRGDHPPPLPRYTLRATRLSLSRLPGLSERLLSTRIGRTLALAVPMTSRGWRLRPMKRCRWRARFAVPRRSTKCWTTRASSPAGKTSACR